ncbi:hypothetical protein PENARI_c022G03255 [Penicillium arizonense]|uniref:Flavin reductase like domain-containing protein n=1 Tax=Penicillium arizonense TaxID=1835702 RepID=A0A1F5L8N7_PENAI|nr:hypothetical protein PENARI_c022G03255 [Penicillium arizonense]OGE49350.1 hypothetical protein PENARI_c022G03255 [Penicillium arizonense]
MIYVKTIGRLPFRQSHNLIREYRVQTQSLKPFRMSSSTSAATAPEGDTAVAQKNYKIVQDVGNFAETEAKRPDFDQAKLIEVTKSPYPNWKYGEGVPDNGASLVQKHHEIDPYAPDRPMINNYRLLVSGIAPRPVGFLSTINSEGQKNLSPFSYFQVIDHDPPMFIVGFSSRPGRVKDTYRNLKETRECVINTVSENMIEAVNATAIDAPYGVSEWEVSGLHEAPSTTVKPSRVKESVFNIEGKVIDIKEFTDHQAPGMSLAATVLIKATRFWVKEGTADADYSHIDLDKLRPIGQLGGVSYGRVTSTFERPRSKWDGEVLKNELLAKLDAANPNK